MSKEPSVFIVRKYNPDLVGCTFGTPGRGEVNLLVYFETSPKRWVDADHGVAVVELFNKSVEGLDPLRQGIKLGAVETERANRLFPRDEREAVCELLRRAKELPGLRKALLFQCAYAIIVHCEQMLGGSSDWINAEVERVKKLHSGNDAEAITELLTRSRGFPDQRTRMITMTAVNAVAVSRLPRMDESNSADIL
jgi:hypothetical protein